MGDDPRAEQWFAEILIACPACGERATDTCVDGDVYSRRITCEHCGYARSWTAGHLQYGSEPVDPFSDCRLWLSENTPKGYVFAYNRDNLEALRGFVSADHRQRTKGSAGWSNQGYFSRLPKWIKDRSNRDMILRKIEKMDARTAQRAKST